MKAALSNKEYQIITECAVSNISETPHVIPQLNHGPMTSDDAVEANPTIPQDAVALESENADGEVWVVTKVSVLIGLVELRLYAAVTRDTALATVQVHIFFFCVIFLIKIWI